MCKFLHLLSFLIVFTACSDKTEKPSLIIAASSNIQFALEDLVEVFEKEHDIECDVVLGSSGRLSAQIHEGAPYDLFISANSIYPEYLVQENKAETPVKPIARGALILCSNKPIKGIEVLKDDAIKRIAIAKPLTAPYGKAAQQVLINLQLLDSLKTKLVYGESVAQVNQYLINGNVDLVITSLALVKTEVGSALYYEAIPDALHHPIVQSVVVVKRENRHPQAKAFLDFLDSQNAKQLLQKHGYRVDL